jgi:hypothetical protein
MRSRASVWAALVASAGVCASAQAVISTHSGVVHYFEGKVYLSGQPLQSRLGKFSSMADGAELRTEEGRAEVLLTPGVILRVDQNSAIRMLSNSLDDTRVELLAGSAMLDAGEPAPGTSLTLIEQGRKISFPEAGLYRLDSAPPRLEVREGEAQVIGGSLTNPVSVERGMALPLDDQALAQGSAPSTDDQRDAFDNWSRGREDSISADNAIAANIQDPKDVDTTDAALDPAMVAAGLVYPQQPGFTQFPMIGLTPMSPLYSSMYPYQPGFFSPYLPGYTYQPVFLLVSPMALRNSPLYSPYSSIRAGSRMGTSMIPGSSIITPRIGVTPRIGGRVSSPYSTPYSPIRPSTGVTVRPTMPSVRPGAAMGPRVGGRR